MFPSATATGASMPKSGFVVSMYVCADANSDVTNGERHTDDMLQPPEDTVKYWQCGAELHCAAHAELRVALVPFTTLNAEGAQANPDGRAFIASKVLPGSDPRKAPWSEK